MQVDRFAAAGTELPSKTQIGRIFFLVNIATPTNSKIYASFAVDTWTEVFNSGGGAATVSSVFARVGAVVAADQDYTFDKIDVGTNVRKLISSGQIVIGAHAAPADATFAASQFSLWLDDTNGAGKLMIKGKTANGTVVSGSVTLS